MLGFAKRRADGTGLACLALLSALWHSRVVAGHGSRRLFAFGFLPAVLALALYFLLPVLRNTITGLQGFDPAILEAAQGLGSDLAATRCSWWNCRLALPVRGRQPHRGGRVIEPRHCRRRRPDQASAITLSRATDAELGVSLLFGCFAAAALALVVDQLLALVETGIRNPPRVSVALAAIGRAGAAGAKRWRRRWRARNDHIVGARTFTEHYVLAALMAQRLRAAGLSASCARRPRSQCDLRPASAISTSMMTIPRTMGGTTFHRTDIKPRQEFAR